MKKKLLQKLNRCPQQSCVSSNVNIGLTTWKNKCLSSLILWNDIYPRSNRAAINHVQMRVEFFRLPIESKRRKKSSRMKVKKKNAALQTFILMDWFVSARRAYIVTKQIKQLEKLILHN